MGDDEPKLLSIVTTTKLNSFDYFFVRLNCLLLNNHDFYIYTLEKSTHNYMYKIIFTLLI